MTSTEVSKTTKIPVGDGAATKEEVRKWVDQQIPYANLAGLNETLDEEVAEHVDTLVQRFRQRMMPVYSDWATNRAVANGEAFAGEFEDDIHVPETYKMVQSKVAHIEESVWGMDPPFATEGVKEEIPRAKAMLLQAFLHRQMELAGYKPLVRPAAKDIELHAIAVVKLRWERIIEDIVERESEYEEKNGRGVVTTTRRIKKGLSFDGVALDFVDPFRVIFDLTPGLISRCEFIGDESDQFVHDLKRYAELGLMSESQVKKVEAADDGHAMFHEQSFADQHRKAGSLTTTWDDSNMNTSKRSAARQRVVEMWMLYDFKDGYDGIVGPDGKRLTGVHKIVATICKRIPLQIRLNPHDKKFAPYAIGLLDNNGHDLISVAPVTHTARVNAQYDRYQSALLRHAELTVDPIVLTGNDSDLPDSLLGVKAGTVFRNIGQIDQIKIQDLPQSSGYMHNWFRREHEETSGALRIFEQPQGTATETERKVQEQNRLMRSSIRANCHLWRQVALMIYWMNGQFSTRESSFRVLGKASSVVGSNYGMMTPDLLQDDIDIRFHGAETMQSYNQKVSGLNQWMNQWGPLLPAMPRVDIQSAAEISFEHMVGPELSNRIFKGGGSEWMQWDQTDENWMLLRGNTVAVGEFDDDQAHLEKMLAAGLIAKVKDPKTSIRTRKAVLAHILGHIEGLKRKEAQRKAEMQRRQQDAQMQQISQQGQEQGAAPPGGMEPKAKDRTTNGPQQSRTVSKTGRAGSGTSQTQREAG